MRLSNNDAVQDIYELLWLAAYILEKEMHQSNNDSLHIKTIISYLIFSHIISSFSYFLIQFLIDDKTNVIVSAQ